MNLSERLEFDWGGGRMIKMNQMNHSVKLATSNTENDIKFKHFRNIIK